MVRSDLTFEPLRTDQYKQVAEWEYGPQEGADWERYAAEMSAPQWLHFGLYQNSLFVGCISLEKTGRTMAEFHVVTARSAVHPNNLAIVLLDTAAYFFNRGFTGMTARIPKENRAAARLAIRCGMWEWGHTSVMRYFILTRARFQKYGWGQAEADQNAI